MWIKDEFGDLLNTDHMLTIYEHQDEDLKFSIMCAYSEENVRVIKEFRYRSLGKKYLKTLFAELNVKRIDI